MDDNIISNLEIFKKPDKKFIEDKECLICLESIDIESNKIVKLPCGCANSVYHIICIIKLLHSGKNKNFCPHCKTKYIIPIKKEPTNLSTNPSTDTSINSRQQVAPLQYYEYIVINRDIEQINEIYTLQLISFSHIILFHILTNSIMNIINISMLRNHHSYNQNPLLQALMLLYFCKIFFNYCFLLFSKNNVNKIESCLVYSYMYQIVLVGSLIYSLAKIKYNYNCTILIINNIFLSFTDLIFRLIIEYRMKNRINILG